MYVLKILAQNLLEYLGKTNQPTNLSLFLNIRVGSVMLVNNKNEIFCSTVEKLKNRFRPSLPILVNIYSHKICHRHVRKQEPLGKLF